MPSRDTAVSVRGLSKSYTIRHADERHTRITEAALHALRSLRRPPAAETFWALRDVEFDIHKGDVVGIVGRNGAGKSTLLKVLSRITEPTAGQIDLYGRVGSLLEVGTGFHAELTGRENIYMNGAILGMSRREIARHFEAIVEFAEVSQFLDTPVKRYSSGMYVRLAFAVAAHLNPEILIVDEVLAVGDAAFQKKCLGKMHDVAEQEGRTVLFVSHNMTAVQSLCNRAILLKNGRVQLDGETAAAIAEYQSVVMPGETGLVPGQYDLTSRANRHRPGELIIRRATIYNSRGQITDTIPMGEEMALVIDVEGLSNYRGAMVGVKILSNNDQWLVGLNTEMKLPHVSQPRQETEQVVLHIPRVPFAPGTYWFEIGVDLKSITTLDFAEHAAYFNVIEADVYGTGYRVEHGIIYLDADWHIRGSQDTHDSTQLDHSVQLAY